MDGLDLGADLHDPGTYPKADELARDCDVVMKGGITSGVIYPHAVCQLATTHRLRSVGGTSAGAIAAAAAAAAERGRDGGGFVRLAQLPLWLAQPAPAGGSGTNLFGLFQPQRATRPLHRLAVAALGHGGPGRRAAAVGLAGLRLLRPLPLAVLCVPGLVLTALAIGGAVAAPGVATAAGAVAAVALLAGLVVVAVAWSVAVHVRRRLPVNGFGLCSGAPPDGFRAGEGSASVPPALTAWLADELDTLAGMRDPTHPLTFGDLRASGVELAMLTTDLTDGTQQRAPLRSRVWAFDPAELERLFPARVVAWMLSHPPPPGAVEEDSLERFTAAGLRPLPVPDDLPVVVGVRLSLSFPLLLSAVPLHRIDFGAAGHPLVRHWFSDGGITSNFPMHFFDSPLPTRPTFGINLGPTTRLDDDEARNLWLPGSNLGGLNVPTRPIESVTDFVVSLKDCLQNWADNAQTHVPGYRDRIVKVFHTRAEGGLNLDMDGDAVARLARRGRAAGAAFQQRFDFTNHRWLRYRTFMQLFEQLLQRAATGYGADPPGVPTYDEMIAGPVPSSYRRGWRSRDAATQTAAVLELARELAESGVDFSRGAPSPQPVLQARPDT